MGYKLGSGHRSARVGWGGAVVPLTTALRILSLPAGRKEFVGDGNNWVRKSDENDGKWTNEPERAEMGAMRNALFKFRLGRGSIVERDLTR